VHVVLPRNRTARTVDERVNRPPIRRACGADQWWSPPRETLLHAPRSDRRVSRARYDDRCETSAPSGLRSAIGATTGATMCSIRRCWAGTTRGGAPSCVRREYGAGSSRAQHHYIARTIASVRALRAGS